MSGIGRRIAVDKVLSSNDLGLTGSHQAGIHVPREIVEADFFPALPADEINPSALLDICGSWTSSPVQVRYVYYNNKLHAGGTRNEYRITRIIPVLKEVGARPGDRLMFRRVDVMVYEVAIWRDISGSVPSSGEHDVTTSGGWTIRKVEEE